MRGRDLIRLLQALELLSKKQGTTIKELSEKLEVSKRTVYYKIRVIEGLGIPIYEDKIEGEREKRWKLEENYLKPANILKVPDISLTPAEVIALYLLRSEDRLFGGTDVEALLDSAFFKFGGLVPDEFLNRLSRVKTLFASQTEPAKDYSGKEELIEALTQAMLQRKTCLVKYHSFSSDEIKGFYIDPLHFFESSGGLYVFVRATRFGDIRTLAVERIQELSEKEDGATFEYPEDFDPEKLLDSAFGIIYDEPFDVKIWFSADQARYIKERTWSPKQKITDEKDGGIVLEMTTCGRQDIRKWVMSFGTDAKLLEPGDLRSEIAEELAAATASYSE
jgi:predicted DNA-binding transcriptional regulator YafY